MLISLLYTFLPSFSQQDQIISISINDLPIQLILSKHQFFSTTYCFVPPCYFKHTLQTLCFLYIQLFLLCYSLVPYSSAIQNSGHHNSLLKLYPYTHIWCHKFSQSCPPFVSSCTSPLSQLFHPLQLLIHNTWNNPFFQPFSIQSYSNPFTTCVSSIFCFPLR